MSMLTPPGMGGKYRITGDRYPRMRRRPRRRRKVVLSVLAVATGVALISWGAMQLVDVFTGNSTTTQAGSREDCATAVTAAPKPRVLPKPGTITVNIYNATTRSGLAQDTADELEKRGFKIGKVDNAPARFDGKVEASGLLMGSPHSYQNKSLSVLGTQLPSAETRTDKRKSDAVDLVIGDSFKKLAPTKDATQALATLASPPPAASTSC